MGFKKTSKKKKEIEYLCICMYIQHVNISSHVVEMSFQVWIYADWTKFYYIGLPCLNILNIIMYHIEYSKIKDSRWISSLVQKTAKAQEMRIKIWLSAALYISTYVRYSFLINLKVSTKLLLDDSRKGLLLIKRPNHLPFNSWVWVWSELSLLTNDAEQNLLSI